jgi:hypothetical protein
MASSRNTAGFICLGLLTIPLLLTPFRGEAVATFVHTVERRGQTRFPEFRTVGDYFSAKRWEQTERAMGDRFPLRDAVIPLKRGLEFHWLGKRRFGDVERGRDDWLFWIPSYDMGEPDPEHALRAVRATLVEIDRYTAEHRGRRARLILAIAPDKASLYPEQLRPRARACYDAFLPARRLFEEHFTASQAPELLDLWTPYRAERDRTETLIYERLGTHHTQEAGLLMARAIVERAQPGAWEVDAVVRTGNGPASAELVRAAGVPWLTEEVPIAHVERAGITVSDMWLDRVWTPNPLWASTTPEHAGKPLYVENSTRRGGLIPGKTLIVHDSFIGNYLRPVLWQYFEEVSFLHQHVVENCELELAFDEYDLIVIEIVERHSLETLRELFAPCEGGLAGVKSLREKVR